MSKRNLEQKLKEIVEMPEPSPKPQQVQEKYRKIKRAMFDYAKDIYQTARDFKEFLSGHKKEIYRAVAAAVPKNKNSWLKVGIVAGVLAAGVLYLSSSDNPKPQQKPKSTPTRSGHTYTADVIIHDLPESSQAPQPDYRESVASNLKELNARIVNQSDLESRLRNVDSKVILPEAVYKIDFDITVQPSGTLEIEPGTRIEFGENGGIICYGNLKAIGTQDKRINFTASGNYWKNITISLDPSILDRWKRDTKERTLKYCTISRGRGRINLTDKHTKFHNGEYEWLGSKIKIGEGKSFGGGLLIFATDPRIENCIIEDNSANYGGGVYVFSSFNGHGNLDDSNAVFINNIIKNNSADHGGGILFDDSDICIDGNTLESNNASDGGGIYIALTSRVFFKNNFITRNSASNFGGGIYIGDSEIGFKNTKITSNHAKKGGGGITIAGSSYISPSARFEGELVSKRFNEVDISDNSAEKGGGLYSARDGGSNFILDDSVDFDLSRIKSNRPDDIFNAYVQEYGLPKDYYEKKR